MHKSTKLEDHQTRHSIKILRFVFDYGPPELNLFKYVAEEAHFLWEKAKKLLILRDQGEPTDGFILIQTNDDSAVDHCLKKFDFDVDDDEEATGEAACLLKRQKESVNLIYVGEPFGDTKDKAMGPAIKDKVKHVDRSNIFFLTVSDKNRVNAVEFCKKYNVCPISHVLSPASDKRVFYETFYHILEQNLRTFLYDLESRKSTRQLHLIKCELKSLFDKLRSRKISAKSLTKTCLEKIKKGKQYGIAGYRLCGKNLYVFEDENKTTEAEKMQIEKEISDSFNGTTHFRSLKYFLTPQCAAKCGGYIKNGNMSIMGTLGMFGEIYSNIEKSTTHTVALSSPHVIWSGNIATLTNGKKIGECIWPDNSTTNIQDVSIIKIDLSMMNSLQRSYFDKNITITNVPKELLHFRKVFKYGASTKKTVGRIEKVGNFELFEKDVLAILPKSPLSFFSDSGDSGAIVLTKFQGEFYGIGIIYGGQLKSLAAECLSAKKETIAVFLHDAINRFRLEKNLSITFDRI